MKLRLFILSIVAITAGFISCKREKEESQKEKIEEIKKISEKWVVENIFPLYPEARFFNDSIDSLPYESDLFEDLKVVKISIDSLDYCKFMFRRYQVRMLQFSKEYKDESDSYNRSVDDANKRQLLREIILESLCRTIEKIDKNEMEYFYILATHIKYNDSIYGEEVENYTLLLNPNMEVLNYKVKLNDTLKFENGNLPYYVTEDK